MTAPSLWKLAGLCGRAGTFTLGGGDPTMASLRTEFVERQGWLTADQYALAYALCRVTPGTNLLAFCAAVGCLMRGVPGAVVAVAALSLPSTLLVVLLTGAYGSLRGSPAALGAAEGATAAAAGAMLAGAWLLIRPALSRQAAPRTAALALGAFCLAAAHVPPVWVLLLAAAAGALWRPGA